MDMLSVLVIDTHRTLIIERITGIFLRLIHSQCVLGKSLNATDDILWNYVTIQQILNVKNMLM